MSASNETTTTSQDITSRWMSTNSSNPTTVHVTPFRSQTAEELTTATTSWLQTATEYESTTPLASHNITTNAHPPSDSMATLPYTTHESPQTRCDWQTFSREPLGPRCNTTSFFLCLALGVVAVVTLIAILVVILVRGGRSRKKMRTSTKNKRRSAGNSRRTVLSDKPIASSEAEAAKENLEKSSSCNATPDVYSELRDQRDSRTSEQQPSAGYTSTLSPQGQSPPAIYARLSPAEYLELPGASAGEPHPVSGDYSQLPSSQFLQPLAPRGAGGKSKPIRYFVLQGKNRGMLTTAATINEDEFEETDFNDSTDILVPITFTSSSDNAGS